MGSSPKEFGSMSSESFLISFIDKLDKLLLHTSYRKKSMSVEIKSLEFWRSIIAECLSTFFYVFLVSSVHISWTGSLIGHTPNWIVISLTSGLSMATLTQCFGHISGAHVNPAVTCAFLATSNITPLRAALYIIAQCGGAIAGAALLYGVSIPGHQGALGIALAHEALGSGQIFGVEFVLTFLIVFTIFATYDINRNSLGSDAVSIGTAYLVATLTGLPASGASFNPARALGPAFVMNRWKHHWVYWFAPITGSMLAGLIYKFIFDSKKSRSLRDAIQEIEKDSNGDDHYEEPEVKMSNKNLMGYSVGVSGSGSSHSNSGSSSSSTHQSNNTGYSSINSGPGGAYNALGQFPSTNTFQHTVITHDGLYLGGNLNSNGLPHHPPPRLSSSGNHVNALPPSSNYHHVSNNPYGGIYGTKASTLRHLPNRMEYNNARNEISISSPTDKY